MDGGSGSILISSSCTTSWFDWIHGELWLCPDGLLRRSLGLAATIAHGVSPTLDATNRPRRDFTFAEITQIVAAGRRNRWVPWTAMTRATLKLGIIDHSLHIELGPGKREKFLWLKAEGGFDLLEDALRRELPGRFEVINGPIG